MNKKYRRSIVAGNWKMNLPAEGIRGFADGLQTLMPASPKGCSVVICAPATHIGVLNAQHCRRVATGAQSVSTHESGAHTGEISAAMLSELGVRYCIVGHSESRTDHGETDDDVNDKVRLLLKHGITPIICVGESYDHRRKGLTLEYIAYQVKAAICDLTPEQVRRCVFAYEPVWAIGKFSASPEQAQEVCFAIREQLRASYGALISRKVSILYGGGINPENCREVFSQPDIDGGLVGGAALRSADFAAIVTAGCEE